VLCEGPDDFVQLCVAVRFWACCCGAQKIRSEGLQCVNSFALPRFVGECDEEVFERDLSAVGPVGVGPCEAGALFWDAEGLEQFKPGTLMIVLAGFDELVGVQGFADVMNGGAEADQVGTEVGFWKFGSDAVDQRAGSVMDEHEVSDQTRRSKETLTDAHGVRG
jgi:hypothetical protein